MPGRPQQVDAAARSGVWARRTPRGMNTPWTRSRSTAPPWRTCQPPSWAPRFDPATLRPGIVHLGLGGFHRAHMARYTHSLMDGRPDMLQWGIVGAGLMPGDRRMGESLHPQDNLYTLVERSAGEETVTVIGSLAATVFAGEDSAALLDAIDQPGIRIVSLTVTENGYCLNRATKQLDPDHRLIQGRPGPARPTPAARSASSSSPCGAGGTRARRPSPP